jgi:hypothetical protein
MFLARARERQRWVRYDVKTLSATLLKPDIDVVLGISKRHKKWYSLGFWNRQQE